MKRILTTFTFFTCLFFFSPNELNAETYACVQQGATEVRNGQVEKVYPQKTPTILTFNGNILIFDGEEYGKVHLSPDLADTMEKKLGSSFRGIKNKEGLYVHTLRSDKIIRTYRSNETKKIDTLIHVYADSNSRVRPMQRWAVVKYWSCND
jgi:hypothetical protein